MSVTRHLRADMAILWLDDPRCSAVALVGAKAAHLSRLSAQFDVPPGFCITSTRDDPDTVPYQMSPKLRGALDDAYTSLAARCGCNNPAVAVRSSAVDEDGSQTSFAGQHATFLNVAGLDAVIDAVERCWASAGNEDVLVYRRRHGLSQERIRPPVLIQQLVMADVSAIIFSANPVTGQRAEIIVTASWGLGESLVGGTVTPDSWVIRKDTLEIIDQRVGDKRRMTVLVDGGTREVDTPRLLRERPALSTVQVRELAQLGIRLEETMDWPVDVECAFADGHLYLLQCRPITTLG
jgi:phosphoenolpyruvate synthase/pyruvate phosphate dikinase